MERQRRKITPASWILFILILLAIGAFISKNSQKNRSTIKDGHITRTCEQLLKDLEEEPEDLTAQPYVEHIPKQIQQDIDTMLNAEEELDIVYTAQGRDMIRIQKNDGDRSNIIVYVKRLNEDYYSDMEEYFVSNLSFYRNGKNIVIYGSESSTNRHLMRTSFHAKTGFWDQSRFFWEYSIDLFGANVEYQMLRPYNSDMTLLMVDDQFMFYRLGEQLSEKVGLPKSNIQEATFYYVLSENNELYYLYYCANPEKPWIRLVKVDENVQIAEDSFVNAGNGVKYQIYWRDGKRYAAISNLETERAYGQCYGRNEDAIDASELDFTMEIIELSPENVTKVVLQTRDVSSILSTTRYDWYLNYSYEANGQIIYETQRIDGLDNYLYGHIPSGVLEKYEGMSIGVDQVEEIVNELKEIYAEYETTDKFYEKEPPAGGSFGASFSKLYFHILCSMI